MSISENLKQETLKVQKEISSLSLKLIFQFPKSGWKCKGNYRDGDTYKNRMVRKGEEVDIEVTSSGRIRMTPASLSNKDIYGYTQGLDREDYQTFLETVKAYIALNEAEKTLEFYKKELGE